MATTVKKKKAKVSASKKAKPKKKVVASKKVKKTNKTVQKAKVKTKKVKAKVKAKVKKTKVKTKKTAVVKKKTAVKSKAKTSVKKKATAVKVTPVVEELRPITNIPQQAEESVKPKEDYMNKEQIVHFKSLLLQWKKELMDEVNHTLSEMKEASSMADPNDCATYEENFNLELRTRDRERKLLKKINEALQKIENEDYGYCDYCGIEIGIQRLEARPTATLCIDCKTLNEIKERRS